MNPDPRPTPRQIIAEWLANSPILGQSISLTPISYCTTWRWPGRGFGRGQSPRGGTLMLTKIRTKHGCWCHVAGKYRWFKPGSAIPEWDLGNDWSAIRNRSSDDRRPGNWYVSKRGWQPFFAATLGEAQAEVRQRERGRAWGLAGG
jgi:hypothetical protein